MTIAREAEALGYDSLWVLDRLLYPVSPRTPYGASRDGSLPPVYKRTLDPFGTLTFAAACTSRIGLGTSVLNLPFYNPVLLARQLTSIDVLSGGRLIVGLGTGWSQDEYEAAGSDWKSRGARTSEAIDLLRKMWTEEIPEHHGAHYSLPKTILRLRPVQKPHPPIYLAAFTEATMKRVAERADGWNPAGLPSPRMKAMFDDICAMAQAAGRDPAQLKLVVRANLTVSEAPEGADRGPFVGSFEQICEDISATRDIGAHELFFDPQFSPGLDNIPAQIALMRRLRDFVG
jgi:probable F420-dependent oxidoreductase